jgi:tetratricopeptide (TPR) repeat protein
LPIAERAALAAIRADNEDPWAHLALGYVNLLGSLRRLAAEFELALQLNPNFSLAQSYYGLTLSYCGRWEEGDIAARRALRLSPRDPFSAMYCGIAAYAQFLGRHYDQASPQSGKERGSIGNPFGSALDQSWLRWAAAEGVSETVIAAVSLLHERSVEEIAGKLTPAQLADVTRLVSRCPAATGPECTMRLRLG